MKMEENSKSDSKVRQVGESRPLSPYTEALFEAGKTMFIESVKTVRDFCKYMISVCTGAIPIYLGLMAFFLPRNYEIQFWDGVIIALPPIILVGAAIIFVFGYFPRQTETSLEIVEEIEKAIQEPLKIRRRFSKAGFLVFLAGFLLAIISLVLHLSPQSS